MSHVSWRDHIRPLIAGVLARTRQLNEAEVRRALRAARPSEYRLTSWGRKCWLREVREQLDALQRGREYLGVRRWKPRPPAAGQLALPLDEASSPVILPGQMSLFL